MNFQSTRFSYAELETSISISEFFFRFFASSFLRNLKRSEKLSTFFFVRKRQKGKVSWIYFFLVAIS